MSPAVPSTHQPPISQLPNNHPGSPNFRGRPTFEGKISTVLTIIATFSIVLYYFLGGNFLPLCILLPIAGQVLSRGILALSELILDTLGRVAIHHPLPLDLISSFILEMDTRTGGHMNFYNIVVGGFVSLFLINTPEVLLGTYASGQTDIRALRSTNRTVELACYGGAYNRTVFYSTGLLLLASTEAQVVYEENAYFLENGDIVVPRKPTIWYEKFAEGKGKRNDAEKRIYVPHNHVGLLRKVQPSETNCILRNVTEYDYWVSMKTCEDGIFGFEAAGPHLKYSSGFFKFYVGHAGVKYFSSGGHRKIKGSDVVRHAEMAFPKHVEVWEDMSRCFLHAVSFAKNNDKIGIAERISISGLVRIGSIDNPLGFSKPPVMVLAEVMDVRASNASRWLVVTMVISLATVLGNAIYFRFRLRVLSRELGQWVAIGAPLVGDLCFPLSRYSYRRRRPFETVQVMLKSREGDFAKDMVFSTEPVESESGGGLRKRRGGVRKS